MSYIGTYYKFMTNIIFIIDRYPISTKNNVCIKRLYTQYNKFKTVNNVFYSDNSMHNAYYLGPKFYLIVNKLRLDKKSQNCSKPILARSCT